MLGADVRSMRAGKLFGWFLVLSAVPALFSGDAGIGVVVLAMGGTLIGILRSVDRRSAGVATSQASRIQQLTGHQGVLLAYEGGHPAVPVACDAALRPCAEGVELATFGGSVMIQRSDVVSLALDRDVQRVGTGGGRDLKGAAVGYLVFGPLGGIIGSRSKDKVTTFDESRIVLVVRVRGMQCELRFRGREDAYARVSGLFA